MRRISNRKVHGLVVGKKTVFGAERRIALRKKDLSALKKFAEGGLSNPNFTGTVLKGKEITKSAFRKKVREKDVFIVPLEDAKSAILNEEEYKALTYLARGGAHAKNNALKNTGISPSKLSYLQKLEKELPSSLKKELSREANEELKSKKNRYWGDISYHTSIVRRATIDKEEEI